MATLQFTEEQARRLEILYSTPDVRGQREEALRRLALDPGQVVIDVGCGPGYLSESIADAVSARGRVVGIDVSDDLLEFARRRNQRSWLMYCRGDAMALPEPNGSFDVAVSMQVLEYISDADRGMREMFRVLKPGGRALAVATDWDGVVWHSLDPHRMRRMLQAWEAHCTDPRAAAHDDFPAQSRGFLNHCRSRISHHQHSARRGRLQRRHRPADGRFRAPAEIAP